MNIVDVQGIRKLEEEEIASGTPAEVLMERAGRMAAAFVEEYCSRHRSLLAIIGRGNNGGDGLVITRELLKKGWVVYVYLTAERAKLGPLCKKKLDELVQNFPDLAIFEYPTPAPWTKADYVLDSILGIGMKGELQGELANLVMELNEKRNRCFFETIAVDCPTGLWEGSKHNSLAVVADLTIAIGYGKDFLFREELSHFTGRIEIIPIFEKSPSYSGFESLTGWELACLFPFRSYYSHKGNYGRVVIFGGSIGYTGAPVMAAQAALRIGSGLVYIGVPQEIYSIVATKVFPECLVFPFEDKRLFDAVVSQASVVAMGPGFGLEKKSEFFFRTLMQLDKPLVIDADCLTLLARNPELYEEIKKWAVLTPHPGEMKRLLRKEFSAEERMEIAKSFVKDKKITLVLKGVRTLVAQEGKALFVNTSGNPGLSTGGSGDSLLGIIAGLIAQGFDPFDAARCGVWIHGKSADIAAEKRKTKEGLLPMDVAENISAALLWMRSDLRRVLDQKSYWNEIQAYYAAK
ncbi:NAD(P)H-hydrate dehydratase [Methylacidiphilum caldifontis]|uniref:Bifunctional NAD(P)H-hydrate repair enzyme n=1 Tax=Methylacidiphilum caldifontis TaxID=2795386 RepID=A0A4Y8PF52_9BACT|nr:NAD(P)H-hydrate dehydratase [Methylacidiphilum caldifontis]QSR88394.1 NAD(P)H-hydrate dehydratase [Methylacidiphilum caldifontis]TFE70693.1 NAD(P)H-hydrate dehydratase [Methylacidiphilum caldifontis]